MSSGELPTTWLPPDNIDNIVSIELTHAEQSELDCINNVHVFLEYPWAYVTRRNVTRLACEIDSSLGIHKDQIDEYKPDWMLIGYASSKLLSNRYVICLTEEARDFVVNRNREISRGISWKVTRMLLKNCSDSVVTDRVKTTEEDAPRSLRPAFEIEVTKGIAALGRRRDLDDRNSEDTRDGCISLEPSGRLENVPMQLISKSLQTTLEARDASIQTYLGYPKSRWTQYDDLFLAETPEDDGADGGTVREASSPTGHSELGTVTEEKASRILSRDIPDEELQVLQESLKLFFDLHLSEMTDCIRYNSEINMHSDDIDNLSKSCDFVDTKIPRMIDYNLYESSCSLVNLSVTKGKIISDVAWHPNRLDYVALCYVNPPKTSCIFDSAADADILVWSIANPLRPRLLLADWKEPRVISFCPTRDSVLVAGCKNGQIVLWDLERAFNILDSSAESPEELDHRVESSGSSDPNDSHVLPICAIDWLPSFCRIESNGKLSKIPDNLGMQFMTSSEDGSVAIWDLLWQPNIQMTAKNLLNIVSARMSLSDSLERLDGIFRPLYRLNIQPVKESFNLALLDLSLSASEVYETIQNDPIDPDVNESARKIWLSTSQGEIVLCTWRGQELDEVTSEVAKIEDRSPLIHNGPVIKLLRSNHITDVLLSIGGSVFALWKDNYLRRPLLWRRRIANYTSCCWCHKPGVFILSRDDGDLETWDILRKSREPIHIQTISGNLITRLETDNRLSSSIIGICDYNGSFKIHAESIEACDYSGRIEWFRRFLDRELLRKREFYQWQDDYLVNDKMAVERKSGRLEMEARKRREEAREKFLKDQEEAARLKAERRALRVPKSKEAILKMNNAERMKEVLLAKKGFDPDELDETRRPIVKQQEEKIIRMIKVGEKVAQRDNYYSEAMSVELAIGGTTHDADGDEAGEVDDAEVAGEVESYLAVRDEALRMMKNSGAPKFQWSSVMQKGKRRKDAYRSGEGGII